MFFLSVLCGLCFASKGCYSPHPIKDTKYLMKSIETLHSELLALNRTISITHCYAENYTQHTVGQTSIMASLPASCTLPAGLFGCSLLVNLTSHIHLKVPKSPRSATASLIRLGTSLSMWLYLATESQPLTHRATSFQESEDGNHMMAQPALPGLHNIPLAVFYGSEKKNHPSQSNRPLLEGVAVPWSKEAGGRAGGRRTVSGSNNAGTPVSFKKQLNFLV